MYSVEATSSSSFCSALDPDDCDAGLCESIREMSGAMVVGLLLWVGDQRSTAWRWTQQSRWQGAAAETVVLWAGRREVLSELALWAETGSGIDDGLQRTGTSSHACRRQQQQQI